MCVVCVCVCSVCVCVYRESEREKERAASESKHTAPDVKVENLIPKRAVLYPNTRQVFKCCDWWGAVLYPAQQT